MNSNTSHEEFFLRDRVMAVGTIDGNNLDCRCGTVISTDGATSNSIGVQFDDRIVGGHDCGGRGTYGFCWWCTPKKLQLIKEDEDIEFETSNELINFLQSFKEV